MEKSRQGLVSHITAEAWLSPSVFGKGAETRWRVLTVPLPVGVQEMPPVPSLHPRSLCGQSPDDDLSAPTGSGPSCLSVLIRHCSCSHLPHAGPWLSLKQASSAATPGPLRMLFSLMKCLPQLGARSPVSGPYSHVTSSVWPSLTSLL